MSWLSQNWIWVVFFLGFVAMHMFGHGGHSGHGQHGRRRESDEQREPQEHAHEHSASTDGAQPATLTGAREQQQRHRRHGC